MAHVVLFILTRGVSKISMTLNIRRIFAAGASNTRACDIILLTVVMWACLSPLAALIKCGVIHFYDYRPPACPGDIVRFISIVVCDVAVELCLMTTFCLMVNKLQMNMHKKARVMLGFNTRLLFYIGAVETQSGAKQRLATMWQQVALGADLILAILPFVQNWLEGFKTFGLALGDQNNGLGSHELSTLDLSRRYNLSYVTTGRADSTKSSSSSSSKVPMLPQPPGRIWVEASFAVRQQHAELTFPRRSPVCTEMSITMARPGHSGETRHSLEATSADNLCTDSGPKPRRINARSSLRHSFWGAIDAELRLSGILIACR
ncbi:hypothetical protein E4T38_01864 [Aureobasidium subglaciale]|nr:hypothetical protein E4T38_01864 [Aureobasidium subglaciale]KAI5229243.1 hypothetical protein E4T40_01615 [Aureobasidium subglaciale]KAI5232850.1 hypothetical protein E4T41_01862 [Aureobasidium subglaciale]KAI5266250.1 hypothetical protein E4T46_01612 [Aureobasidium subglaciale]